MTDSEGAYGDWPLRTQGKAIMEPTSVTSYRWLSPEDIDRIRRQHPLVDVLQRVGIAPPSGWDGQSDFMICCPCTDHDDSTPSCVVHAKTNRFHCFGCGAKGDVLEVVKRVEQVQSLTKAADILDSRRALVAQAATGSEGRSRARKLETSERPDVDRTGPDRVFAANAEAWRYLTLPQLADRGRNYLRGRCIDLTALEAHTAHPLVGHTPFSQTGLVDQLERKGFTSDEIVDSGWGSRRDDRLHDRFHKRLMIPVRDELNRLIGAYGRDITGRANQKYLNTAETVTFHKRSAMYRTDIKRTLNPDAAVVVCEGSLDALAIEAAAASAGALTDFVAVSPSGTALTAEHARLVLAISQRPPVVCGDGDDAGIAASSKWVETLMAEHREATVTVLPDGHDPASWLAQEGSAGLCAFVRAGCLDRSQTTRPISAGGLLASQAMRSALSTATHDRDPFTVLPVVLAGLVEQALLVPEPAATDRFTAAAGRALAEFGVGTESGLARTLARAVQENIYFVLNTRQPAPDSYRQGFGGAEDR